MGIAQVFQDIQDETKPCNFSLFPGQNGKMVGKITIAGEHHSLEVENLNPGFPILQTMRGMEPCRRVRDYKDVKDAPITITIDGESIEIRTGSDPFAALLYPIGQAVTRDAP